MTTTPHDATPDEPRAEASETASAAQPPDAPEAPEATDATEATDAPVNLQLELEKAQEKMAQLQDQALRATAEMENVRRRSAEEVTKARKFAIESFAESLVPVRDSLEAALAQTEQSNEDFRTGIDATLKQLTGAFERNHLKDIAPAVGEKFDPHQHQAIATVPSAQEANTVVVVLQKGYLIADRVLRPALVTVAA